MDEFERVIRPIVEGQIRGFIKEHPSTLKGVDWYKPRDDKAVTLANSLSKRIVRDLTCATSRARLAAALSGTPTGAPSNSPVEPATAAKAGRVAFDLRVPFLLLKKEKKTELFILLAALLVALGFIFRGMV